MYTRRMSVIWLKGKRFLIRFEVCQWEGESHR
jgi:hypothetical protein